MKVPLLDLQAQHATIKDEIRAAIESVFESQIFILGPEVEKLEKAIASYTGTPYAVGVSSGTDALLVALLALDIGPGEEVITTPFTFFSSASVISRLGARPVFVDIDPSTFNIDPALIDKAVTPRTKAIIAVHLFGQCADMDPILAIAKKRGLKVIEDAAQTIGAEYRGRKAGSIGDLGIFSFFPSKNLGGAGDGGMVVMNDKTLFERVRVLRVHGMEPKYYHRELGGNFRLDALQAAVLNIKLPYLNGWSRRRQINAELYDRLFQETGLIEKEYLETPQAVYRTGGDKNYHIYNQYTLRAKDRDKLQAHLRSKSVGNEIYYPVPLHLQECFKSLGYRTGDFPVSEQAAAQVLSLPIYPELTSKQKNFVVETITMFYGARP